MKSQIVTIMLEESEHWQGNGLVPGWRITMTRCSQATPDQPRRYYRRKVYHRPLGHASVKRVRWLMASLPGLIDAERWMRPYPQYIDADTVLAKHSRLVAHVICESLGYATPQVAASIIAAAYREDAHYCEWINHCFRDDPRPAVKRAIQYRHDHKGFMADYPRAKAITDQARQGNHPLLASWF